MAAHGAVRERARIGGILRYRGLARLGVMSIPDRPGIAAAILGALGASRINVPFVVQCIDLRQHTHVIFCIAREEAPRAQALLRDMQEQLQASAVTADTEAAIIAIHGPDFRERPGIAGTMFLALADVGINILAISTSISTVSCVIREADLDRATAALEAAFALP